MARNERRTADMIPDIVIRRLPIYGRALHHLLNDGAVTVSSDELASRIGVTAAQIRRDLSYFGRFGKQGKGYDIAMLIDEIYKILKLDRQWSVALVGFGNLGRAIADYRGFESTSFRIVTIFDRDPEKIGQHSERGVVVRSQDEITETVRSMGIAMGVVAVPANAAQCVTDALVDGGVRALLNYAPVTVRVPDGVWVREIDPISAMQSLTYYLDPPGEPPTPPLGHGSTVRSG